MFDLDYKLKEDEKVCDKCGGVGYNIYNKKLSQQAPLCDKCQGDGVVDWISNVTGKQVTISYDSTSVGNISQITVHTVKENFKNLLHTFLSKMRFGNKKEGSSWRDPLENNEEYFIDKIDKKMIDYILE